MPDSMRSSSRSPRMAHPQDEFKPPGGIEPPDISFAARAVSQFGTEARNQQRRYVTANPKSKLRNQMSSVRFERTASTFAEWRSYSTELRGLIAHSRRWFRTTVTRVKTLRAATAPSGSAQFPGKESNLHLPDSESGGLPINRPGIRFSICDYQTTNVAITSPASDLFSPSPPHP